MRGCRGRDDGVAVVMDPRGDEPEFYELTWDDGVDFAELDCVEIECELITLSDDEWDSLRNEPWK